MKTILKFRRAFAATLVVAAGLLLSSHVLAQQGPSHSTPEDRAKMMTDRMKEKLSLTDEQYQSVYDLNLKYAKKQQALMQNRQQERQEATEKAKALKDSKDGELKGMLTADQYKQYTEDMNQMRSHGPQRPPRDGSPGDPSNSSRRGGKR